MHILTAACLVCTVTCRQFLNLTFAPRKTCYIYLNSNLALLRYQCHNICIIQESFWECKGFFVFFQIHFGRKESGTGGVCVRRAAAHIHRRSRTPFWLLGAVGEVGRCVVVVAVIVVILIIIVM